MGFGVMALTESIGWQANIEDSADSARCRLASMRVLILTCLAGLVAACASLPWVTRDPPQECGFAEDAEIKWAGHGDPVALGLVRPPPGEELGTGEIWVTEPVAAQGDREGEMLSAVCYIPPPDEFGQGIVVNTVPEGWEPP